MERYEQTLQASLESLDNDPSQSTRAVATAYNVPETTLRRRHAVGINRRVSHEQQQRLSRVQEEFLVDWILEHDLHGYPPSHARARDLATRIPKLNGDMGDLGHKWVGNFIRRKPRVARIIGWKIEAVRALKTTQEANQSKLKCTQRESLPGVNHFQG